MLSGLSTKITAAPPGKVYCFLTRLNHSALSVSSHIWSTWRAHGSFQDRHRHQHLHLLQFRRNNMGQHLCSSEVSVLYFQASLVDLLHLAQHRWYWNRHHIVLLMGYWGEGVWRCWYRCSFLLLFLSDICDYCICSQLVVVWIQECGIFGLDCCLY